MQLFYSYMFIFWGGGGGFDLSAFCVFGSTQLLDFFVGIKGKQCIF